MSTPRVLAVSWIPLERTALCLDCEVCYALGAPGCPACGSAAWTPLATFLRERGRARPGDLPDRLVSFRAVEDRLGNGLTPARLVAEELAEVYTLLVDLDLVANADLHRLADRLARQISEGIAQCMASVRALPAARAPHPVTMETPV